MWLNLWLILKNTAKRGVHFLYSGIPGRKKFPDNRKGCNFSCDRLMIPGMHASCMNDRFISTSYRTDCYHCREVADQIIRAMPNRADVICEACGATRVFVPRIEDVDETGKYAGPGRWPVWSLAVDAACRNCKTNGPHDITVSCRAITVRCRNCRFTHLYRFDLEYIAGDSTKDSTADPVTGRSHTCP